MDPARGRKVRASLFRLIHPAPLCMTLINVPVSGFFALEAAQADIG